MCSQVFEHSATEWRVEWEKLVCIQGHCYVYGVTVITVKWPQVDGRW